MAGQESTLRVGVDSSGAEAGSRRVNTALGSMGTKAKETQTAFTQMEAKMHGFSGVMGTIMGAAVGLVAAEFTHLLNITQVMDNQLKLVTNSTQDFAQVQQALFEVATRTRGSLESTVEMYRQMQQATYGMGYSQQRLIDTTETINKALALTGTSGIRAKMGILQLAEGLDLGTLRGQHLRALITDMPGVAMAIAKGLSEMGKFGNITIGMLMNLGKQGKLTSKDLMEALGRAAPWVNEQFAKTIPTISQSFNVLETKLLEFTTHLNHATGIGTVFSGAIMLIANHVNTFAGLLAGLALVISGKLLVAFYEMSIALATNPFGAILIAVGALAALLGYLSDQTFTFGQTTATGFQVAKAAVLTVWQAFQQFWGGFKSLFADYYQHIADFVTQTWASLKSWLGSWGVTVSSVWGMVKGFFNVVIGVHLAFYKTIATILGTMPAVWEVAWGTIYNVVIKAIQLIVNTAVGGLGLIGDAVDKFTGGNYGDEIRKSLSIHPDKWDIGAATKQIEKSGAAIGNAWKGAFSTDYLGNFGAAFTKNLNTIVDGDKKAAGATDLLNQVLGGNTQHLDDNKKAHDKLKKAREDFIQSLKDEYNKILEANGHAAEAVDRWYADQITKLNKLGLAHTIYAQMLDDIFTHKLQEARVKDVQNTEAWARRLNDVQRGVAKDIHDEWTNLGDVTGNATKSVEDWYTQEKRLLTAAGLDHSEFAKQAEDVYKNRLAKARVEDIKNATGWAAGLSAADREVLSSLVDTYNGIREATGGSVASLNEWYQQQKQILVATGHDHDKFAQALEDVYANKLPEARNKDIASMQGWSRALSEAQRQVADSSGIQALRQTAQQVQAVKDAMQAGVLTTTEYANQMRQLGLATLQTKLQMGNASWADATLASIGKVLDGFVSIKASVSDLVGNALQTLADGFANAIGGMIAGTTSLREALFQVAQQALSALIAGLVKMGIQWALNAVIGQSIAAAVTAASMAQATALATAWAPAAAMASLATMGGNAAPAAAAIAGTTALAQMMALTKGFATGGPVSGPGSGTSDSIFAKLSNGEFVINAKSAKEHFGLLQAINSGMMPKMAAGGVVNMAGGSSSPVVPFSRGNVAQTSREAAAAQNPSSPQSAPATVKVRVMNFTDPKEALKQLDTADGEHMVMNILQRNGQQLKQIVGA